MIARVWGEQPHLGEQLRMRFETALAELVGNVIAHARPAPDRGVVTMEVTIEPADDHVGARLVDDAETAPPEPADTPMPASDAESGRGSSLARLLSDELTYRRAQGSNEWRLVCRS